MEVDAAVARAALDWFAATPAARRKLPQGREWAVLAAFVLRERGSGACRVLAAATGNKCLGRRELRADGLAVHDCHAEVLARRALLRFLYAEAAAAALRRQPRAAGVSVFEWREATQRLALRPEFALHLYISEAPCGDAAIYALQEGVVRQLASKRVERAQASAVGEQEEVERSALRLTGAKTRRRTDPQSRDERAAKRVKQGEDTREEDSQRDADAGDQKFAQLVGVARVKSGRSDLPPDKQTLSMSCSDKIAKWTVVGVQGSLLLRFFEPLLLSSVVVPLDPRAASLDAQWEAMQRAIVTRLEATGCASLDASPCCQCAVVADGSLAFDRSKTSALESLQPSALALNWTRQEPHWIKDVTQLPTAEEAGVDQRWLSKFLLAADVEVLMAATGLRQGAKKASKLDRAGVERVASRLAKRNLFRAFCVVHSLSEKAERRADDTDKSNGEQSIAATDPFRMAYSQAKEREVSAPQPSTAWIDYLDRRRRFVTTFQGWVGVPSEWKSFTLT